MPHLSRDERLQVLTLRSKNLSYNQIAVRLGITKNQVHYTIDQGHPTPKKKTGRPPLLDEDQVQDLVAFVCASRQNRRMPLTRVAEMLGGGHDSVRSALCREGFGRSKSTNSH